MSSFDVLLTRHLAKMTDFTARLNTPDTQRFRLPSFITRPVDFLAKAVFHVWRNRRYLSAIKLLNMAAVNLQCHFKTQRVIGQPYRMKIEPTNICNTQCQLCPTGLGFKGRDKGSMKLDQFKSLLDQFRHTLYTLDLSMWGDPLIVPDIYNMIRHAHKRGIWTYLSSNLHAFKPDKNQAHALVESGLDMLTCSLHGATQDTYEQYQPGKKLQPIIEKIRAIVDAKKQLNSQTPEIQLNFVVTRFNEHEMQAFRNLAESLDCKPVFSSPSLNLRFIGKDKNLVDIHIADDIRKQQVHEQLEHWLPENTEYVIKPYQKLRQNKPADDKYNGHKTMDCQWPWKDAVINWDGSVVTCCGVFDNKDDMGNVFQTPFRKIWNNQAYQMARLSFKKPVEKSDEHPNPCRDCPGFLL